jgi:hypothetical protein
MSVYVLVFINHDLNGKQDILGIFSSYNLAMSEKDRYLKSNSYKNNCHIFNYYNVEIIEHHLDFVRY